MDPLTAAPMTRPRSPRCFRDERRVYASRQHRGDVASRRDRRLRGLPCDRRQLGAPAHVHDVREDRVLRLLAESPRHPSRRRIRTSHHPLRRAGRGLELVLRRRSRLRTGSVVTLPELHLADWRPTKDTLHLYCQILGKVRLATTSPRNHWWNAPLYVDVRGLSTRRLHHGETEF